MMYRKCRKEAVARLVLAKLASIVQCACTAAWTTVLSRKSSSGNHSCSNSKVSKRCLPDFSDIAHLTVAFEGICLPNDQMTLVKDSLEHWSRRAHSTPGQMVHRYIMKKYPSMRTEFDKYHELTDVYQNTVTNIIYMAVESVDSLDDSLGPLLVSYAEDSGIFSERGCFDRYYWQRVCEALCELSHHFPRTKCRREVTLAWRIIILFLFYKIEYALELQHRRAAQQFHSFDNPCYVS